MNKPLVHDATEQGYVIGRTVGCGVTNERPGSFVECIITCEDEWSQVQMEVITQLTAQRVLVQDAIRRAKRTSGLYAALFLGDEGTPQASRFYWPGLAAFAAKQVVDGIELADTTQGSFVAQARAMAGISFYYLLKGNLWVFLEVAPWMLFWKTKGANRFKHCMGRRNVNTYLPYAVETMQKMPWAKGENTQLKKAIQKRMRALNILTLEWNTLHFSDSRGALAEMNNLQKTTHLEAGFTLLEKAEKLPVGGEERNEALYKSALSFLNHEQLLHLQAMVYDHPEFQFAMENNDLGRRLWHVMGAKDPSVFFHSKPEITTEILEKELKPLQLDEEKTVATMTLEDGSLYNPEARMKYIGDNVLKKYHSLMTKHPKWREYMIKHLRVLEGWKDA